MNPTKLNMAAVATVLVLTAGFGFGLVRPGLRAVESHREELSAEALRVREEQAAVGNISELYASIMYLSRRMEDFEQRLPRDREFGEFLNQLSECLRNCGIEEYKVEPQPGLTIDESKLPADVGIVHGTHLLPVRVEFVGRFEAIVDFLRQLEDLPRLSHVEKVQMINRESRPGRATVELVIHTYYRPSL